MSCPCEDCRDGFDELVYDQYLEDQYSKDQICRACGERTLDPRYQADICLDCVENG